MGFYILVIFLMTAVQSKQIPMDTLEDVLVYPLEAPSNIQKQHTSSTRSFGTFSEFVEEKLIQHSQALEHLVKIVRLIKELIRQLILNVTRVVARPKLPKKLEVNPKNRRSNDEISDDSDNPFVKLGKNLPKYGNLMKDVIMQEIQRGTDPTPLIESNTEPQNELFISRRSNDGGPNTAPSLKDNNEISPWCSVAIICRRSINPICGYDENFGFGKFEDICHMLQVNCYWKYNFSLVPSCKPTL